jgi:probable addiction module antidote protein
MFVKASRVDAGTALDTHEAIGAFLSDAFETGDTGFIAQALGIVARAKGVSQAAFETVFPDEHPESR